MKTMRDFTYAPREIIIIISTDRSAENKEGFIVESYTIKELKEMSEEEQL